MGQERMGHVSFGSRAPRASDSPFSTRHSRLVFLFTASSAAGAYGHVSPRPDSRPQTHTWNCGGIVGHNFFECKLQVVRRLSELRERPGFEGCRTVYIDEAQFYPDWYDEVRSLTEMHGKARGGGGVELV